MCSFAVAFCAFAVEPSTGSEAITPTPKPLMASRLVTSFFSFDILLASVKLIQVRDFRLSLHGMQGEDFAHAQNVSFVAAIWNQRIEPISAARILRRTRYLAKRLFCYL